MLQKDLQENLYAVQKTKIYNSITHLLNRGRQTKLFTFFSRNKLK
jgi:hypothetical protein